MAVGRFFVYNQQIEEIAKRARAARSNEELASVCRQLNIADSIFLGKVDLWLAKNALSALYRTLRKYPALRGSMHYFGTLNGFINNKISIFTKVNGIRDPDIEETMRDATDEMALDCLTSFKNNCLAVAIYVGTSQYSLSGIIINGKSMNQQDILKHIEFGERLGYSPRGCNTIKSVIEHEIGHVLDQMLGINSCFEFQQILSQCSVSYLRKNLSKYCVMNNTIDAREVIAEAYSEYCNNPHPRELARAIGMLIDKKYKEK